MDILDNYKEFEISIKPRLTQRDVSDLLCSASDIGYWGEIDYNEDDYKAARERLVFKGMKEDDICFEDVLSEILWAGRNLNINDVEEDDVYILTLDKLINGFIAFEKDGYDTYGALSSENGQVRFDMGLIDGGAADMIIQLAVFGEIVFC